MVAETELRLAIRVGVCYNATMKKNVSLARNLRKNATSQEQKFWQMVRNHSFFGLEFRRQYPIGDYIVDFICRKKNLIVELDGGQHNTPEAIEYDKIRTDFLKSKGYLVLRFWNFEIDNNIDGVYEKLVEVCGINPHPKI